MLIVSDIADEIRRVLGQCDDSELFARLNEAVDELSAEGNWNPAIGTMDICTYGCDITLPDDVEVPLAINVGGRPADFRNKWFEFHLNGPGSQCCQSSCNYSWTDKGEFPTFRDPVKSSLIAAYPAMAEDLGASIRVYGYDSMNKWIMEEDCNGVLQDGFDVPILYGPGSGTPGAMRVKRITRIAKPVTNGFVRLVALDPGVASGSTLLGLFRPSTTNPSFRRISVSGAGCQTLCDCTSTRTWVRMKYSRRNIKITSLTDPIFLSSVTAIKQMVQAIKKYEADLGDESEKYRELAKGSLQRHQKRQNGPNQIKIVFDRHTYGGQLGENMV